MRNVAFSEVKPSETKQLLSSRSQQMWSFKKSVQEKPTASEKMRRCRTLQLWLTYRCDIYICDMSIYCKLVLLQICCAFLSCLQSLCLIVYSVIKERIILFLKGPNFQPCACGILVSISWLLLMLPLTSISLLCYCSVINYVLFIFQYWQYIYIVKFCHTAQLLSKWYLNYYHATIELLHIKTVLHTMFISK